MNKDFGTSKTTKEARSEMKTKHTVPKFGVIRTSGLMDLKKRAARNSTSFHHLPRRSQAKIGTKKAREITKTGSIRSPLSHKKSTPPQKVLPVSTSQLQRTGSHSDIEEPKAVFTMKKEQGRILSKKSLLQNRAHLLSITDAHDSDLHFCKGSTPIIIRHPRRMPVFPPVSSSHANAQPVTSNECRVSLVGEGGGKKARFTRPTARQSVEGKCLLVPSKLSVVSLKLPDIIID